MKKQTMQEVLIENDLCLSTNEKGTDKGSYKSYIDEYYSIEFEKYRDRPISLMEIGFRHGASLALWSKYFADVSILGLDNHSDLAVNEESPIVEKWVNQPNIKTKIGDAYSQEMSDSINESFDIIIDDGPHWISTQQIAMQLYLPKLKKDGVFIVEDILRGGLAIFPLLRYVPLNYNAYFFSYGKSPDDCLFIVKHNNSKVEGVLNHIGLALSGVKYIFLRAVKKVIG